MTIARYLAVADERDAALDEFEQALAEGWIDFAPTWWIYPEFEALKDHPRVLAGQALLAERMADARAELGLQPFDLAPMD